MASTNRALDEEETPEQAAAREASVAQQNADAQAKANAQAAADKAKAAGRDPALATLLKQLGGDNEATRAISAALYDRYGISSLADLGRGEAITVPDEYTDAGDSGASLQRAGYTYNPFINKNTGQQIGDLGFVDKDKVGTTKFYLKPDGSIGTEFTKRSHGLWDQGLGNLLSVLNVIPGANLATIPITAGRAALNGNVGQALAAVAPLGLDYLANSTGLLSNLAGPDFNPMASTPQGMLAEAAGLGLQGLPADILGNAVLGAAKSGLTGGDVGTGALLGGAAPLIGQGVKSLTGGVKDLATSASNILKGDAGNDLLTNSTDALTGGTGADDLRADDIGDASAFLNEDEYQDIVARREQELRDAMFAPDATVTTSSVAPAAIDSNISLTNNLYSDPLFEKDIGPGSNYDPITGEIIDPNLTSASTDALVDPFVDSGPPADTLGSDLTDPFVDTEFPADSADQDTVTGGEDTIKGGEDTTKGGEDTTKGGQDIVTGGGSNIINNLIAGAVTGAIAGSLTGDKKTTNTASATGSTSPDTVTLLTSAGPAVSSVASVVGTTSPDTVTLLGQGMQNLPTSTGEKRYWRQTGQTGNNGQGGVRFFDWYDTPENRTVTPASAPAMPMVEAPPPPPPAPTAKQYFNQATNRYYTDPTGTWQPPAGWTQTTLKDGGKVETKKFDGEDGSYVGWDDSFSPVDPGIFDFDIGIGGTGAGNFDYVEDTLSPAQREALNNARWESGYFGTPEEITENYSNEGRAYSGANALDPTTNSPINVSGSGSGSAIDKLLKLAKDNPNATKALLAAGLGGLLGYAGRPKAVTPKGMQAGSLGLTQSQVYNALKGIPVQRAEGGEIDGYAKGGGLHYLKSAEDGMADRIPATIDNKQPARLSGGEFVIPADVVSHLGNGNSEAGAKQLYDMMDRIRHARTGTKKQGKQVNPAKFTPK